MKITITLEPQTRDEFVKAVLHYAEFALNLPPEQWDVGSGFLIHDLVKTREGDRIIARVDVEES